MRSVILSQYRDLRIGVTREDLGALTTVRARQLQFEDLRLGLDLGVSLSLMHGFGAVYQLPCIVLTLNWVN